MLSGVVDERLQFRHRWFSGVRGVPDLQGPCFLELDAEIPMRQEMRIPLDDRFLVDHVDIEIRTLDAQPEREARALGEAAEP